MEVEKDRGRDDSKCSEERSYNDGDEEERETLPGFRFHPTDEELVGFYLKRKVEKRLLRLELIKHVDIYKYDPWDLPRLSTVRDKEWYFFCIRGRKYRNSIRPNRVTGSGFWKATGIDKPIYSAKEPHDCIGLKKSLVYYRGSAGKGTKTDWMMHEFRLPTSSGKSTLSNLSTAKSIAQEAEVWTLCRIFKRIPTHRKYTSNLKENTINQKPADSGSKTDSLESSDQCPELNVSFRDSAISRSERKPLIMDHFDERNYLLLSQFNSIAHAPFTATSYSGLWNLTGDQELYGRGNSWDELRSVVERAVDPCQAFDWI